MPANNSIRTNTSWVLAGNLGGKVLGFIAGVILARLLAPESFGYLVTVQIFTGAAGFIAGGGMGEALVQARKLEKDDFHVVFTIQLIICTLIYLGFYTIAPAFAVWFDNEIYQDLLRVSALTFLIRPFANLPNAKLRREMRFKEVTAVQLAMIVVSSGFSIYLAWLGYGVWALVYGGLLDALLTAVVLLLITRWRPRPAFNKASAKLLGGYGIKFSSNSIVLYLRGQTANFAISHSLGPGPVGLFNKADSLALLPVQTISGSAYQVVFRVLSQEQDNLDRCRYLYLKTLSLVSVYTLPFYVGLLWLAEPFIVAVYGDKWIEAGTPLQILALAGIFRCIGNPSGAVAAAKNRLGTELVYQLQSWVLLTIGCAIGLQWGIVGVAWGILPSIVYLNLRMAGLANEAIGTRYRDVAGAIMPSLLLSIPLLLSLGLLHLVLPADLSRESPFAYLAALGLGGGLVYGMSFLWLPIPALREESDKWRRKLKLARPA